MRRMVLGAVAALAVTTVGGSTAWSEAAGGTDPTCEGKPAVEVHASPATEGTPGDDAVVLVGEGAVYDALGGDDTICLSSTIAFAMVNGGGGADHVSAAGAGERGGDFSTEISGGAGDDEIIGTAYRDHIDGGSGDDVILAGGGGDLLDGDGVDSVGRYSDPFVDGADHVDAGRGYDRIYSSVRDDAGDSGADESIGGPGRDTLDYGPSRSGVVLRVQTGVVEGAADDVPDSFQGFERYRGSGSADLIVGTDGPDELDGDFGRDRVLGLGGDDRLDLVQGRASGGAGDDVVRDSANGPRLRIAMGPGDDLVELLQGRHTVALGPGADQVSFTNLRGTYAIDGGRGPDVLTTIHCNHSHVGDTVTCGASTATVSSIERFEHRSR